MQQMTQVQNEFGNKRKKLQLIQNLADGTFLEEQTEVKLALMRMDKVCITKIACSNKHSLAVSSIFISKLMCRQQIREQYSLGVKMIMVS